MGFSDFHGNSETVHRMRDMLAHQRLPPALLATLAAARAAATGDFKGRIEAGSRYRALAQSEWWAF